FPAYCLFNLVLYLLQFLLREILYPHQERYLLDTFPRVREAIYCCNNAIVEHY
ncbi:hypothetical protein BGZ60DRAFT_404897, partial [Tricladium varicosporioides]